MQQSEGNDDEVIEVFLSVGTDSFDSAPLLLPSRAAMKLTAAQRRWKLLKNLAVGCRRFNSLTANERRFLYEEASTDTTSCSEACEALTTARDSLKQLIATHTSRLTTTEAHFLEDLVQSPNATVSQLERSAQVLNKDPLFNESQNQRGSLGRLTSIPKRITANDSFRSEVWTYSKPSDEEKEEKQPAATTSEKPVNIKPTRPSFLYRFFAKRPKKTTLVSPEEEDAVAVMLLSPVIFSILGTSADDLMCQPHVLSPPMMDALRPYLPFVVQQDNFWLKYSMVRDGASMRCLLSKVRTSARCLIAIETMDGQIFGSFTSTPFRPNPKGFYGSGEAFVWKLAQSRLTLCATVEDQVALESTVQVFEWTGSNRNVQSLHSQDSSLLLGGGGPDSDPTLSGGSALTIEANMEQGFSDASVTFDSPVLCGEGGMFEIANLEVWTLTPVNCHELAQRLELGRQFVFDHGHFAQH